MTCYCKYWLSLSGKNIIFVSSTLVTFLPFLDPFLPTFHSFLSYSFLIPLLVTSVVIFLLLLPSGLSFTVQQFCHRSKAFIIIEDVKVCKLIIEQCCEIT
jgi:hypothetical protein